jgi:mannose-6-phosphate isomerase-like protein (cupin superfamily)
MEPFVVEPGEGASISPIGGDRSAFKALGTQTGGTFALMEQIVPPGHGPRRHVHRREEESFYILEGEFGFEVGERQFVAGPGSFVFGPRGIPHRFWNARGADGRFLLIISPAGLEPFFEGFSRVLAESPGDLDRQAEVASRYGLEFVWWQAAGASACSAAAADRLRWCRAHQFVGGGHALADCADLRSAAFSSPQGIRSTGSVGRVCGRGSTRIEAGESMGAILRGNPLRHQGRAYGRRVFDHSPG